MNSQSSDTYVIVNGRNESEAVTLTSAEMKNLYTLCYGTTPLTQADLFCYAAILPCAMYVRTYQRAIDGLLARGHKPQRSPRRLATVQPARHRHRQDRQAAVARHTTSWAWGVSRLHSVCRELRAVGGSRVSGCVLSPPLPQLRLARACAAWMVVTASGPQQRQPQASADDSDSSRGATIPLVSSEWGYSALWPTAVMRENEGKDIFDPASPTGCDEALQAKFLPRMWLTNLMQGVRLSIWYNFKDGRLASGAGADQSHFGLVRADPAPPTAEGGQTEGYHWPPKQGFFAARAFTRLLAGRALVDTCANLSWWAAAVPPLPQPPPLPPHPRPPATTHCRKLNVSGAAADNSFVVTFDRLFDGAHRNNSTVAAASGGGNESQVIVFWCADVTRLPCALTLSPVLPEKPLSTSANGTVRDEAHGEAGWPIGACFEQRSFTGELLDPVCTVAADNGAGGSVLKVFADNAPTYLSARVDSKQLSTVHHTRT
eukprot:COSAG05_NODE_479_length_9424_cov_38.098552_3_plen_487_part_00